MEHHPAPLDYAWNFAFIALFILFVAVLAARKLNVIPKGFLQNAVEQVYETFQYLALNVIGPHGKKYTPFIGTVFAFILLSNLWGQFAWLSTITVAAGFHVVPPTAGLNTNLAIALTVFLYVQFEGIRANGAIGYLKHFAGPMLALAPLMFFIEVIGELAKPLSLSLRLYGNIFGEEQIIGVLAGFSKMTYVIPLHLPMAIFGVFTSVVQALVFTMLTCIYLSLMTSHDHEGSHDENHDNAAAHAH